MTKIEEIEERVKKIEERNKKVEIDKAWETSLFRRVLITILTYFCIVLFLFIANLPNPLINAIIPSLAFLLSTLTLSFLKNIWVKRR